MKRHIGILAFGVVIAAGVSFAQIGPSTTTSTTASTTSLSATQSVGSTQARISNVSSQVGKTSIAPAKFTVSGSQGGDD